MTGKHRLTVILLHLSLALSINHAVADAPMDGRQKIHECVQAARQAGLYPGRCVGVLADPCINSTGGKAGTVAKARQCAAQELQIWAARLDKSLTAIRLADADLGLTVAKAQRAWGSSNEFCTAFDRLDQGAAEYCLLQATATRALLLEGLALSVNEH